MTIGTPHTRTMNGFTLEIEAYTLSEDRYNDGRDFHYFELHDQEPPAEMGAIPYHDWTLVDGTKLNGYLVEAK